MTNFPIKYLIKTKGNTFFQRYILGLKIRNAHVIKSELN